MFKYGKKAGYMGIALLVLAVIPLVVAACVIPNIGPEVATKFNAAGEVTRWGKSYELLALPAFDRNGKSAGIWLNPLTTDDGNGLPLMRHPRRQRQPAQHDQQSH